MKFLGGLCDVENGTAAYETVPADEAGNVEAHSLKSSHIIPRRRIVSRSSIPLLSMTWERDWPNVVKRCKSHPREATYVTEGSLRTALHLACFNHGAPCYVVDALLKANRFALLVQDSQGYTPLHVACTFRGADDLVPLFCSTIMQIAGTLGDDMPVFPGETCSSPLELACRRDAPISTLRALLHLRRRGIPWVAPVTGGEPYHWSGTKQTRAEHSPLHILLSYHNIATNDEDSEKRFKDIATSIFSGGQMSMTDESTNGYSPQEAFWAKCFMLIREVVGDATPFLHAMVSVAIPVIGLLGRTGPLFADQALLRDQTGHLPLHHVILHPYEGGKLIQVVRNINPAAAAVPLLDGPLPLNMALEKGRSWTTGVAYLSYASPDLLAVADKSSRLYPFMAAATCDSDLDTIYKLLSFAPHLVKQSLQLCE
jgi:hypothetical protein